VEIAIRASSAPTKGRSRSASRWSSRTRYRLFGRYDSCPLPDPRHRARFLDQCG